MPAHTPAHTPSSSVAVGYVGGSYTKEASRLRDEYEAKQQQQQLQQGGSEWSRPEDYLGAATRVATSPRAAQLK